MHERIAWTCMIELYEDEWFVCGMDYSADKIIDELLAETDVLISDENGRVVLLKYDSNMHLAPIIIAMAGKPHEGKRFCELAEKQNVPIEKSEVLVRIMFKNLSFGEEIPSELYQAIAEVLAKAKKKTL